MPRKDRGWRRRECRSSDNTRKLCLDYRGCRGWVQCRKDHLERTETLEAFLAWAVYRVWEVEVADLGKEGSQDPAAL